MVSLGDDSRRSGGYFFHEAPSIQSSGRDTDELLADHTSLSSEFDPPFRKLRTTWAIILQILIVIVMEVALFVIPKLCSDQKCGESPYALIIYAHGGLFFVMWILDRYFRYQHNRIRIYGYLEFYRRTRHIRRLPFIFISAASTVLLIVVRVLDDHCPHRTKEPKQGSYCGTLSKDNYLQIIISAEFLVSVPTIIYHLVKTIQFNRKQASPDVSQDEMMTSFVNSQSSSTDVGYRDENYLDQVLEKQADMIRYLRQHNARLGKRILTLTAENNALKHK